jgi:hypothetical protein
VGSQLYARHALGPNPSRLFVLAGTWPEIPSPYSNRRAQFPFDSRSAKPYLLIRSQASSPPPPHFESRQNLRTIGNIRYDVLDAPELSALTQGDQNNRTLRGRALTQDGKFNDPSFSKECESSCIHCERPQQSLPGDNVADLIPSHFLRVSDSGSILFSL